MDGRAGRHPQMEHTELTLKTLIDGTSIGDLLRGVYGAETTIESATDGSAVHLMAISPTSAVMAVTLLINGEPIPVVGHLSATNDGLKLTIDNKEGETPY